MLQLLKLSTSSELRIELLNHFIPHVIECSNLIVQKVCIYLLFVCITAWLGQWFRL